MGEQWFKKMGKHYCMQNRYMEGELPWWVQVKGLSLLSLRDSGSGKSEEKVVDGF